MQMSFEEIIKTATVVMEEQPEQIGIDDDQPESKSVREHLIASKRLKNALVKICDVKTYDIAGKPSQQAALSYFSLSD